MELTNYNICMCEMSAELFSLSCKKEYDSRKFIRDTMNSDTGFQLYNRDCINMWFSVAYVMETLEEEICFENGKVINQAVMSWIGYLFRCWTLTYPEDTAKVIYEQAPVDTLLASYQGLHVLAFEDAIRELKEMDQEKRR